MRFLENKGKKKKSLLPMSIVFWVKTHFGKLLWNYTFPKG